MAKESKKKAVKKKWLPIIGPKSFENVPLGETHVADPQRAIGKTVNANLMNLTGDMRKQGIEIRFDIVKVQDGKAHAAVTGYELLPSQMKRLVRRGRAKVADSFVARTATGRLVRIKPIVLTANPASIGAQTAIRLAAREKLRQLAGSMSFDRLVQDLIGFKVQRAVKDEVNKHHPIKTAEIKACILLPEGTSERREVREDTRDEDFVEVKEGDEGETAAPSEEADEEGDTDAEDAAEETPEEEGDGSDGEGTPSEDDGEESAETGEKAPPAKKRAKDAGKSPKEKTGDAGSVPDEEPAEAPEENGA